MATIQLTIPFDLTTEEMVLEQPANDARLSEELQWLKDNANADELPRILEAAVCLHQVGGFHIAECLRTAIIWERG